MYYGQKETNTPTDAATGYTTNALPCTGQNNSIEMLKHYILNQRLLYI